MNLAEVIAFAEITPISTTLNESLFNVWTGVHRHCSGTSW